jgi:universal stress protein F
MQRILVAIDGSPRSPHVIELAAALAKKIGARLVLFRAVGLPAELPKDLWKHPEDSLIDVLKETAITYLNATAAQLDPAVCGSVEVAVGAPWQAICAQAKQDDVDLIILGSHGYSGLDRVLGTTAAKVVDHADRSVLVVRQHDMKAEHPAK